MPFAISSMLSQILKVFNLNFETVCPAVLLDRDLLPFSHFVRNDLYLSYEALASASLEMFVSNLLWMFSYVIPKYTQEITHECLRWGTLQCLLLRRFPFCGRSSRRASIGSFREATGLDQFFSWSPSRAFAHQYVAHHQFQDLSSSIHSTCIFHFISVMAPSSSIMSEDFIQSLIDTPSVLRINCIPAAMLLLLSISIKSIPHFQKSPMESPRYNEYLIVFLV